MEKNVTKAELRAFTAKKSQNSLGLLQRSDTSNRGTSTFLSHSSKDQDLLGGGERWGCFTITAHGSTSIQLPPEMPPYTSAETACIT